MRGKAWGPPGTTGVIRATIITEWEDDPRLRERVVEIPYTVLPPKPEVPDEG